MFRACPIAERIYLDHAATTPIRPQARAALEEGWRLWANPSSPHAEGRKAKAALEDARARIAATLGWDGEIILTSGASEAAQLALGSAQAGARLVAASEHDAILGAAPDAERLPVQPDGALDLSGAWIFSVGDAPGVIDSTAGPVLRASLEKQAADAGLVPAGGMASRWI